MAVASRIVRFSTAGIILALAPAVAQQPPPPPAAGALVRRQWVVNETSPTCAMTRPLTGSPAVTLVIRSYAGSGYYDVMLVSTEWSRSIRRGSGDMRLSLGSETSYDRRHAVVPLGGGNGDAVLFPGLRVPFLENLARSGSFTFSIGGRTVATYPVPGAAPAARAFDQCEAAILISWGGDPAGLGPGTTRPRPIGDPNSWVGLNDYNFENPGDGSSLAISRLDLGLDGRPERCTAIETNARPEFGASVCGTLMARARYEHARDSAGHPVRSIATYRFEIIRATTGR